MPNKCQPRIMRLQQTIETQAINAGRKGKGAIIMVFGNAHQVPTNATLWDSVVSCVQNLDLFTVLPT